MRSALRHHDRQGQHADALPAAQEAALGCRPRRPRRLGRDHGRRARPPIKVALAWIEFHGAAQVAQLRRTVTKKGKKTVEVVCLITSDRAAGPAALAAWACGHWHIENKPPAPGGPRQHRGRQPAPRPRSAADAQATPDGMNDFAGSLSTELPEGFSRAPDGIVAGLARVKEVPGLRDAGAVTQTPAGCHRGVRGHPHSGDTPENGMVELRRTWIKMIKEIKPRTRNAKALAPNGNHHPHTAVSFSWKATS
jgi:hypothetical protein